MKILRLIASICLFILFSGTASAEDKSRILLINSDASVEKYKEAQEEFKKALARPVQEIHLEEKKWKLPEVEDFLYDEDPDLVYCIGSKAYLVANKYVGDKDIIFSSIINWQRLPRAKKMYGVSNELHTEMQITLYRYIFPTVKRIGVLYNEKYNSQWFAKTRRDAAAMGVEIIGQTVSGEKDTVAALRELLPKIDALWLISDPVIMSDKKVLSEAFNVCDAQKMPVFTYHEVYAQYGAVLMVSVDNPTLGRQAASIAMEVLAGEKLEERVQFPAGSRIILNLKKIKQYCVEYREEALASVNEIIE